MGLTLAACGDRGDSGPVRVSAIGPAPTLAADDMPSRLLTDATAQGLVRFDAAGQVEPGLAERWIVIDDGTSFIFRLREAKWADGSPVTAEQVVRRLRRRVAAPSNPLRPFLLAIDEIVEMTPQVIEVRLRRPRPDLLKLFAQPELALLRPAASAGTGPMTATARSGAVLLRPLPDPLRAEADARDAVRLRGERAALAVARFAAGEVDLVAGGTFADWPLAITSGVPTAQRRVDPAVGLFGLQFAHRDGFLSDPANRTAIAQALDRPAITAAVAPIWFADERLLPDRLDSALAPHLPDWAALPPAERQAAARARLAAHGAPVRLRIALPPGPGATLLWGQVARALTGVGFTPERVTPEAPADLRLVDAVAPYDSARWYLVTACRPCGPAAQAALDAAREAPTLAERAGRLAEADAAVTADVAFIPIARPFRWSLVSPRLRAWQQNPRAWHPLNRLRSDPT